MLPTERALADTEYLSAVTELLHGIRTVHPTFGVWEAADLQWWWRKPRATDTWDQPFWFDASGAPVAAAVTTDWGDRLGLDVVTMPGVEEELTQHIWRRVLASAGRAPNAPIEVMVDANDSLTISVLRDAGFAATPDKGTSAWMVAQRRPPVSALWPGYRLTSRSETIDRPHHLAERNGPAVEARLRQTSLYQPDLDLVVVDAAGDPVAYGLFWYDPVTLVGLVEPMRTEEAHQRRGLARHILTAGIDRLARAGAARIKISYEEDNVASRTLYCDAGFIPTVSTSLLVRPAR